MVALREEEDNFFCKKFVGNGRHKSIVWKNSIRFSGFNNIGDQKGLGKPLRIGNMPAQCVV